MSRNGNKGFALLIVLWALLLLGTLALSFAFSMRTEALATRNGLDGARAYFQARTGINRAVALLGSLPVDNVLALSIEGGDEEATYVVRIAPENARIDINLAPEELLKEALRKGGVPDDQAGTLAEAILAWRGEGERLKARGGGSPDYDALPEPIKPRNDRFRTVEELRYVAGVTPELYGSFLSKVFTTHSNFPQVNVRFAPVAVLRLLPGLTPERAAELVARREAVPFTSVVDLMGFLGGGTPRTVQFLGVLPAGNTLSVTSVGKAGDNVVRAVRCLVEVGAGGSKPVKILRWEDQVGVDEEGG